jgi:Flp pilus assembly protein TadG
MYGDAKSELMFRLRGSPASPPKRRHRNGQSVLEFALVAPLMIVMLLAVVDVARVYTTMVNVESAAREAADYGTTYGAGKWQAGAPMDDNVVEMQKRACVASSNLPDYQDADADPSNGCQNPSFAYCVTPTDGATCGPLNPADGCEVPTRTPQPCTVTVTLTYDFHLFAPLNVEFFGVRIGFPSTINIQRDSTFAITDIDLSTVTPP